MRRSNSQARTSGVARSKSKGPWRSTCFNGGSFSKDSVEVVKVEIPGEAGGWDSFGSGWAGRLRI